MLKFKRRTDAKVRKAKKQYDRMCPIITFRVNHEYKEQLTEAANSAHISLSKYIRWLLDVGNNHLQEKNKRKDYVKLKRQNNILFSKNQTLKDERIQLNQKITETRQELNEYTRQNARFKEHNKNNYAFLIDSECKFFYVLSKDDYLLSTKNRNDFLYKFGLKGVRYKIVCPVEERENQIMEAKR